jgi:hypothetical protein
MEETQKSRSFENLFTKRPGAILTTGSGMEKIRIGIRNKNPGSYIQEVSNNFWGLK